MITATHNRSIWESMILITCRRNSLSILENTTSTILARAWTLCSSKTPFSISAKFAEFWGRTEAMRCLLVSVDQADKVWLGLHLVSETTKYSQSKSQRTTKTHSGKMISRISSKLQAKMSPSLSSFQTPKLWSRASLKTWTIFSIQVRCQTCGDLRIMMKFSMKWEQ